MMRYCLYTSNGLGSVRSMAYFRKADSDVESLKSHANRFYREDERGWNSGCWIEDETDKEIAYRESGVWRTER